MPADQLIYQLPATLAPKEFKSWLEDDHVFEFEHSKNFTRIYLDTFDWRFFRSGSVLEVILEKGHYLLTWRKLGTGVVLDQRTMKSLPRFASEFIAPGLQRRMRDVIGRRSLMPQISLKSDTRKLYLLDGEEKQQLRLEIRQDRVVVPNSTGYLMLPTFVYLFPYRGYRGAYQKILHRITARGGLLPAQKDPLAEAMDYLHIEPEDYNNRPEFELNPDRDAIDGLKEVLEAFRIIMEKNIQGACQAEDPEYLHDFLIAARRTQCLLNRYPDVFQEKALKLIKQDFEWAEQFASPIRDLDIYLSLFDEFASRLDQAHRASLRPLYEYLQDQKSAKQWQMRTALESTRYKKLMENWKRFLDLKQAQKDLPEAAGRPIREVVGIRIADLYREVFSLGRKLDEESSAEALVALHQTSKKLGYHLELFHSLFPKKKIAWLMEAQLSLQKILNSFHDLNLQHDALLEYRQKMQQEQRTMPVWLETMDLLVEDRERECRKVRLEFPEMFKKLTRKKRQKQVRSLLEDRGTRVRGTA